MPSRPHGAQLSGHLRGRRPGTGLGSQWQAVTGRVPGGYAARHLRREGDHEESTRGKGTAAFQVFRQRGAGGHWPGDGGGQHLSASIFRGCRPGSSGRSSASPITSLYELTFTGGIPGTFEAGKIGALQSIVPGPGPAGIPNDPVKFGDNPYLPHDPDKFNGDADAQREFRMRFTPSGLANEIFLDTFVR